MSGRVSVSVASALLPGVDCPTTEKNGTALIRAGSSGWSPTTRLASLEGNHAGHHASGTASSNCRMYRFRKLPSRRKESLFQRPCHRACRSSGSRFDQTRRPRARLRLAQPIVQPCRSSRGPGGSWAFGREASSTEPRYWRFRSTSARSTKNCSDSGLRIASRLAVCSGGKPIKILRTGTSIFFPLRVMGTCSIL